MVRIGPAVRCRMRSLSRTAGRADLTVTAKARGKITWLSRFPYE
ncbi:hypothetical protein ACR6C2_28020 [Streptomyces sp. INA 01156]